MTIESIARGWSLQRLQALRREMAGQGLDLLVVPRWDRHQGEYCADHDNRLAWATGFSGSWGVAVIGLDRAVLFVDGRYTVQARDQVDTGCFALRHLNDEPIGDWIRISSGAGQVIGYDAGILTPAMHDELAAAARQVDAELRPLPSNPVDLAWTDQPDPPISPFYVHALELAGEDVRSKRRRLCAELDRFSIDILVETQTDNVAWLLNIRGFDLPYTPVALASMLVEKSGRVHLFVEPGKIPERWLQVDAFDVVPHAPSAFFDILSDLAKPGGRVAIDPRFAPAGAVDAAGSAGGTPVLMPDPLTELKAVKNSVELDGLKRASHRDSIAWCRFIAWLSSEVPTREALGQPLDELEAEERILGFRQALDGFVCPSFRTISAADANGAMCHYSAPARGSAKILTRSIYLLDSGGQYPDGTTDTTRTFCFSDPDEQVRRNFTLVLKGHVRLASLKFPEGTRGHQIDAFARESLWRHRLDYDHGTGHGVGHFLSVHEHPQRLAKAATEAALKAGMTITNEPGYYEAGRYGIRIENLCEIVEEAPGWLCLRDMTLVPVQRELIDASLLTDDERSWVDSYHARVRQAMEPYMEGEAERGWLLAQTRALAR